MADLARAIAEALGCEQEPPGKGHRCEDYCRKHLTPWLICERRSSRVAAAIAPLIEARAREVEASSLRKVARWLRDLGHDHLADVLDIKTDQSLGTCPACGAKPGARCLTKSGKRRGRPHAARTNPKEKP